MTESVEWERLADHEEGAPQGRVELTRRPPCDTISYIADQLEASITGLCGLIGVSRTRVVLVASIATLREVANVVLEQGVELDDLRDEYANLAAESSQIADRAGEYRKERDEARAELAVVPERWRELMAERDAARTENLRLRAWLDDLGYDEMSVAQRLRGPHAGPAAAGKEVAEVRWPIGAARAERYTRWPWMLASDSAAAAEPVESGEWKAADGA